MANHSVTHQLLNRSPTTGRLSKNPIDTRGIALMSGLEKLPVLWKIAFTMNFVSASASKLIPIPIAQISEL